MNANWRLGLKIGPSSIGWAAFELRGEERRKQPVNIMASGVRAFSDGRRPRDHESKAVARRLARGMRRRLARKVSRRTQFMEALVRFGLMPEDIKERKSLERGIDPWLMRIKGLDEKLSLHELGRALFHLQQRRGFKSNRKIDTGEDDDSGKIKSAAKRMREAMEESGSRTFGEHLASRRMKNGAIDVEAAANNPVRVRLSGTGEKATYDFYPTREMVEEEFNALWDKQRAFHGDALPDDARATLHDILFFQRDLKTPPVGRCTLVPSEERIAKATPLAQRLRIYQEVNHLRVLIPGEPARILSIDERDALVRKLLSVRQVKFASAHKLLKLPDKARFNFDNPKREHFDGDGTAAVLAHKARWGKPWRDLPFTEQQEVVERLLEEEDEGVLRNWLMQRHGLSEEAAGAVTNAHLPAGYTHLGITASTRVLDKLEEEVVTFDHAVRLAGFDSHTDLDFSGKIRKSLPYYGEVLQRHVGFGTGKKADSPEKRYGKIANPTIHIALNQLRHVVNNLLLEFGWPDEIVVQLGREVPLSAKGKAKLERDQAKNQKANQQRREVLTKLGIQDTGENRLRLRLWEELNPEDEDGRFCTYTGQKITLDKLFSSDVEVVHILPFSRTLEKHAGNKTLAMRPATQFKGRQSPYEAFADMTEGYDWEAILKRTENLPTAKTEKFSPDAMDKYEGGESNYLSRHLTDTRYASRMARTYLLHTGANVWVTRGHLTSDIRWAWDLDNALKPAKPNGKLNVRFDYRSQAIDAVVIGLTDRGLLSRVSSYAKDREERFEKLLLAGLTEPWPGFREAVRESIQDIVVSHKPDHGIQGTLHNDSAYGVVKSPDDEGRSEVVRRVPLTRLTKGQLARVRDPALRERLTEAVEGLSGAEYRRKLIEAGESMSPPVRRVRICDKMQVVPIDVDHEGRVLKAHRGDANYCFDVYQNSKGKWTGYSISRFDAHAKDFDPKVRRTPDGKPLIMRLRANDLILGKDKDGADQVYRVVKMSGGGVTLAAHHEAGPLRSRNDDEADHFRYINASASRLMKMRARPIRVSPAGVTNHHIGNLAAAAA